jgi:hypothetical protein
MITCCKGCEKNLAIGKNEKSYIKIIVFIIKRSVYIGNNKKFVFMETCKKG